MFWSKRLTNKEQERMWRAHEKLGKLNLNLMASDGTQLMDKQKGIQKLKVIKKKLDELIELGFDKIILAGHSSGGWQSLKLKTLYPELITVGPKLSLTGWTTFANNSLAFCKCSSPGVLSIPCRNAV